MPKQFQIPHYIREWAEAKGYPNAAKLADAIGANRSVVSNWYGRKSSPVGKWQDKLAELFGTTAHGLFLHPDNVWISEFLADRPIEEVVRIKMTLESAFPRPGKSAGPRLTDSHTLHSAGSRYHVGPPRGPAKPSETKRS